MHPVGGGGGGGGGGSIGSMGSIGSIGSIGAGSTGGSSTVPGSCIIGGLSIGPVRSGGRGCFVRTRPLSSQPPIAKISDSAKRAHDVIRAFIARRREQPAFPDSGAHDISYAHPQICGFTVAL